MPDAHEGDLALACATGLVDALARGGAVAACISPGSRSTPLVLALARQGSLPVHVHLDERSSAFFALGIAKSTGRPALVVTTSGTAVANLLPAVVEAAMSRTPLILLTADRPPELRGVGANQTIDQIGIFGGSVRWAADLDVPDASPGSRATWRSAGTRALEEAIGPPGGPVHLNLPFREPLVPSGAPIAPAPPAAPDRAAAERPAEPIDDAAMEVLIDLVSGAERGVVLAGSIDPWTPGEDLAAVEAFVAATGWPMLAEPQSQLRRPPHALATGQLLLADEAFASSHAPDTVLQLGAAPTSRAGQSFVARSGHLVVTNRGPADPSRSARVTFDADPCAVAAALAERIRPRATTSWPDGWGSASAAVALAVGDLLDGIPEPFEGRLARDVAAAVPDGATLVVASSMPVRDLDAYMTPRAGLRVIGNRGASGIDGFVSTVLGVAASGVPTFALAGDLSMLHDVGGLVWSAGGGSNAVFVVANNHGGGIFDHLSVASEPEHERFFVTPHRVDLAALASAAGAGHISVDRPSDVGSAVLERAAMGGLQIVEVPIDRTAGIGARALVRSVVRGALAAHGA